MDNMDLISVSAESDNETASDIPGPGRLLGKLYASVGRQLEHALSALAHSMGRGPVPTAERIRNLLEAEAENSRVSAWSAATPNKKLEKNCKVLVKYTRSVRYGRLGSCPTLTTAQLTSRINPQAGSR